MTPKPSETHREARRSTPPVLGAAFPSSIAALALAASLVDLFLFRGTLQVISSIASREAALSFELVARFTRNLSAVLVIAGVVVTTQRAMRSPHVDFGVGRRILLGILSGVLFPVLAISLVMPDSHTTIVLVVIGILAAYCTAIVYGMSAFDVDAPIDQRVSCAFVTVFATAVVAGFVLQIGARIPEFAPSFAYLRTVRGVVEVSYFGLPVSLGIAGLTRDPRPTRGALAMSIAAGLVASAGLAALESALPADFDLLLYGALRLEALDASTPYLYCALFGLSTAGITLALTEPSRRRMGYGAAFVLLCGAGAGAPYSLALLAFGAAAIGLIPKPGHIDDAVVAQVSGGESSQVVS